MWSLFDRDARRRRPDTLCSNSDSRNNKRDVMPAKAGTYASIGATNHLAWVLACAGMALERGERFNAFDRWHDTTILNSVATGTEPPSMPVKMPVNRRGDVTVSSHSRETTVISQRCHPGARHRDPAIRERRTSREMDPGNKCRDDRRAQGKLPSQPRRLWSSSRAAPQVADGNRSAGRGTPPPGSARGASPPAASRPSLMR
jgi:hypothetical protein